MDEGVGDETVDVAEGARLQRKEKEYFLNPDNHNIIKSQEMIIPTEGDYPESPPRPFADVLDGKNLDRTVNSLAGLEHHLQAFPRSMDEAGVMVEELTVKNYNGANIAVVGPSNNRERMQPRQNHWQHFYQLAAGSGSRNPLGDAGYEDNRQATTRAWEDVGYSSFSEYLAQQSSSHEKEIMDKMTNDESKEGKGNSLSPGSIRTKILSKSGFSQFFVKNTLKGKGVIFKGPPRDVGAEFRGQTNARPASVRQATSDDAVLSLSSKPAVSYLNSIAKFEPGPDSDSCKDGVNLRRWLKASHCKVNKIERLYIFKQIVNWVNSCHSQGVALQDLRASCFKLLPSNRVTYIGPPAQREMQGINTHQDISIVDSQQNGKRSLDEGVSPSVSLYAKKHKFVENPNFSRQSPQFPSRFGFKYETPNASGVSISDLRNSGNQCSSLNVEYITQSKTSSPPVSISAQQQSTSLGDWLEENWYATPEELSEGGCTFSANIYCLGVLFFELLGSFDSEKAHAALMADLRHRILPPNFLSENPKEAGFCLWLLHPEPSSRPSTREILQSEVIDGLQEPCGENLSLSIEQEDTEAELLSHFLVTTKEQKEKHGSKLVEDIRCLDADIKEVEKRRLSRNSLILSCSSNESSNTRENKILQKDPFDSELLCRSSPISYTNDLRLVKNIGQLESAYLSMRSKVQLPETDTTTRSDKDLLNDRENWDPAKKDQEKQRTTDRLGAFFDGLCKYARHSKFEVRGVLKNGEFMNSANVICSLSFDRDQDYFATAGVSKKIKIFEFQALFNDSVDIHYPVIEMSNRSKLSCVCWNTYIRNYMASTDYDGVVKLWDANTGQGFCHYMEHQKRAWSVDFSQVDPSKLASGSDDCTVKLWSINEKHCLGTIRKIANVCCVQFSAHSSNLLAFGSADYKIYCYDLRNAKSPWCTLDGHGKAVSFVKFLDSGTLVSASTDNTLKLWDLNKTSSNGLSSDACSLTLSGHSNEKNFVGLSVADGYIACGSETNEVYAYYKSLPMPITSHKFGSIDPISGKETEDDGGYFVSSVCWRGKSDMLIAANSTGCIKVLQMV